MYAKFMFPNVPEFPECPFSDKEKIKYAKTVVETAIRNNGPCLESRSLHVKANIQNVLRPNLFCGQISPAGANRWRERAKGTRV